MNRPLPSKIHQLGCFCLVLLQGPALAGKLFILLQYAEQILDNFLQLSDVPAVADAVKVAK